MKSLTYFAASAGPWGQVPMSAPQTERNADGIRVSASALRLTNSVR
jgi:hypothetical protein